jgi:hypothetical protein
MAAAVGQGGRVVVQSEKTDSYPPGRDLHQADGLGAALIVQSVHPLLERGELSRYPSGPSINALETAGDRWSRSPGAMSLGAVADVSVR